MILVSVIVLVGEIEGSDGADRFIGRHAICFGGFDHVEQTFLEVGTVDDEHIGLTDLGDLSSRGLEVMWVGSDRHDGHDIECVTDQIAHHITEDAGGHDQRRAIVLRTGGRIVGRATAGREQGSSSADGKRSEHGSRHHRTPGLRLSIIYRMVRIPLRPNNPEWEPISFQAGVR